MRVKNMLNYRRPAFWVTAAALVVCVIAAVCFLTNPAGVKGEDPVGSQTETPVGSKVFVWESWDYPIEDSLNYDAWDSNDDSACHLLIFRVENLRQLKKLCDNAEDIPIPAGSEDRPNICDADSFYDKSFFKDHSLLLVNAGSACASHTFSVSVEEEDECMTVHVVEDTSDWSDITARNFMIAVTVDRKAAAACKSFDAVLTEKVQQNADNSTAVSLRDMIPGFQKEDITRINVEYGGSMCDFFSGSCRLASGTEISYDGFEHLLDVIDALKFNMSKKRTPPETGDGSLLENDGLTLILRIWYKSGETETLFALGHDAGGWLLEGYRCTVEGTQEFRQEFEPYLRYYDGGHGKPYVRFGK